MSIEYNCSIVIWVRDFAQGPLGLFVSHCAECPFSNVSHPYDAVSMMSTREVVYVSIHVIDIRVTVYVSVFAMVFPSAVCVSLSVECAHGVTVFSRNTQAAVAIRSFQDEAPLRCTRTARIMSAKIHIWQ